MFQRMIFVVAVTMFLSTSAFVFHVKPTNPSDIASIALFMVFSIGLMVTTIGIEVLVVKRKG